MKARPLLLTCAGVGLGLSILLVGLVLWGKTYSYGWDLARCRSLPDHYSPEWFWMILIAPLSFVSMLFASAAIFMGLWGRPHARRLPWVVLAISLAVVGGGLMLAGLAMFGPCPLV